MRAPCRAAEAQGARMHLARYGIRARQVAGQPEPPSRRASLAAAAARARRGSGPTEVQPHATRSPRRGNPTPIELPPDESKNPKHTPYNSGRACLSLHRAQFVGPEKLQASVLKPHVQRRKVGIAPPLLDDPGHPNELRLPVPFLHPYLHAWTHFVPLHESSPSVLSVIQPFALL